MIDIKTFRNEPEKIVQALKNRNASFDIEPLLALDQKRREILYKVEGLKNEQNIASKQIPALKAAGSDTASIMEEMKQISDQVKALDIEVREVDEAMEGYLLTIPNLPHESVPVGSSELDNVEVGKFSTPTQFDFEPKPHWELGESLGILDFASAAKVTGARFTFLKGLGATLERSIINFFLDTHTRKHGYTEVFPPFMVHRNSMIGTGQLPKFEEDAFKVQGTEYFLIPTAEVPVTNMYREQILDGNTLPMMHAAYSACFRAEAGSAGRDTRGLIRQHQFNKVELVKFAKPEQSYEELEKLTNDAEKVLQLLGLPYRVIKLCTGDLGFSASTTYDIEVWMPSYNRYVEISSCSNFESFQARRANIRFKNNNKEKAQFVHTLNGSGVAIGRTVAAILENYQNADGTITIPEVLRGYMGGIDKITE
ncbi:MAG: serine--tRNA ligase [Hyphomonadaceae bacterium]|nr:serine--tRNA ligase [Clostridia bacterium]